MIEQGDRSLARMQRLELHRKRIDDLKTKGCCAPRVTDKQAKDPPLEGKRVQCKQPTEASSPESIC